MKELLILFTSFFRIGLFTIGGGYAMLPMIEEEVVNKYKWSDKDEILDIFSMSQCTPGVIAVNTATFIGNKVKGFFGALFATLGVITPSIIIITLIAGLISNFADMPTVIHAFAGIRVGVAALILTTCIKMAKSSIKCPQQLGVAIAAFLTVAIFDVSPAIIILVSGIFGLFCMDLSKVNRKKEEEKTDE